MKFGELFFAVVIAAVVAAVLAKCSANSHKQQFHYTSDVHNSQLPTTCTGTIGGDDMLCPCDGKCPSNGAPCDPSGWYGRLHNSAGYVTKNGYIPCPCDDRFYDGEACQGSSFKPPPVIKNVLPF